MYQYVCDGEYRILLILTYHHIHYRAVSLHHHTVYGKRYGHVLVFLDPAVVVGIEISHTTVLIERVLLDVKPRAVYMCPQDVQAVLEGLVAQVEECHGLVHEAGIHLVSML